MTNLSVAPRLSMPDRTFETLQIALPASSYPVHIGAGLLGDAFVWKSALPAGSVLVISDDNVAPLYLESLLRALDGREAGSLVLPAGEAHKTFESWRAILDRLVEIGALRDATLVALGGGVVGDLAGFAAASYMRGIRLIQAPTTLLAQVDASVGGKTAINHAAGKNLIGAFHQPAAVIIDTATLATLEEREYRAGMAEVVKYGAIGDAALFVWLEDHVEAIKQQKADVLRQMIARCVSDKARVVTEDEKEHGVRALLNFGHTFAHALETQTGYVRYLHGEAVAIGMMAAARLSEDLGLCPSGCAERLGGLLQSFGLDLRWPGDVAAEATVEAMALDKKALASGQRLILLEDIGKASIHQGIGRRDIVRAIQSTGRKL